MVWSTTSPALTMIMTRRGSLSERADLFDGVRADDLGALGLVGEEVVDLRDGAVEDRHLISVVVHVEHEVLPHDCQTDQTDITTCLFHISPDVALDGQFFLIRLPVFH